MIGAAGPAVPRTEMSHDPPSLTTRWSMLHGLAGPEGGRSEEAWRWFIERYRPYIRARLGRLIPGAQDADRAADEFWSYLFTSSVLRNADRERSFRSYLAGTVRNYARGWLKGDAGRGSGPLDDSLAATTDPVGDLEQEDLRLWVQQVVQLALEELSKRHAEQARVLRWFYGLPSAPGVEAEPTRPASWIARRLGIQANAVHQLAFRGRRRLRSCIENEVRETVRDEQGLEAELRSLFEVLERESPGLGS